MRKHITTFDATRQVGRCAGFAAAVFLVAAAAAQEDIVSVRSVDLVLDSGAVSAPADAVGPQVVYRTTVGVDDAPWVRIEFGEVALAGDPGSPEASHLRLTSLHDDAVQRLDAVSLRQWRNGSAFFNGSHVQIELIAHPGTGPNSIQVKGLIAGLQDEGDEGGVATICDNVDERILWNDPRVARTVRISNNQHLARCTAFLYGHQHNRIMTAGHCIVSSLIMVEFSVPLSLPDGTPVFAHPDDQYPVDPSTFQSQASGVGQDWGLFETYSNSNTGLTALQKQGESFYLADAAPFPAGQDVYRAGYGITTTTELPLSWNRAQKMNEGLYLLLDGTAITHRSDTTSGDSGSPIVDTLTSLIIGVHTHGGCSGSPGSGNRGTAIHHTAFQAALVQPPVNNTCTGAIEIHEGETLFTTLHATLFGPAHSTCPGPFNTIRRDVYFTYTATQSGTLRISPCKDTDFESAVAVYHGACSLVEENLMGCTDGPPDCGENGSALLVPVTGGQNYTIRVGSLTSEYGLGTLTLEYVPCPADLTGDGNVGVPDLLQLLAAWGPCAGCIEDLTGDGNVGVPDLLALLALWGSCD